MIIGCVLLFFGISLRVLAVVELSKHGQWSNVPKRPTKIVTSGVYRFINHPAYYGSLLLYFGAFLVVPVAYRFLVEMFVVWTIYQNRIEIENSIKLNL